MFYQKLNKKKIGVLGTAYKMINLILFVFKYVCSITPYKGDKYDIHPIDAD